MGTTHFGDAEVGDECPSVFVDHDVRGFDVPVDHLVPVGVGQPPANLSEDRLRERQRQAAAVTQDGVERPALRIPHDEVGQIVRLVYP